MPLPPSRPCGFTGLFLSKFRRPLNRMLPLIVEIFHLHLLWMTPQTFVGFHFFSWSFRSEPSARRYATYGLFAGGGFSRFRGEASSWLLGFGVPVLRSPPAHRVHPILPLLVSFSSLRRSSLRVVATMAAVSGRDGPGEDSVPRAIEWNHRNWS